MIYLNFCERTWLWDDSHDVWGEAEIADRGEDVLSLGYSPDELPDELPGDQHQDGDGGGSVDDEPALRTMWAGGVQSHFKGCGGSKFSKFLYVDSFNGVFYCTQCV